MAKLYWRVKRDGKWTWKPVTIIDRITHDDQLELLIETVEAEE
jgi:hypothetical protein